jgi:hypothetical protein
MQANGRKIPWVEVIQVNEARIDPDRHIFAHTSFGSESLRFEYEPLRLDLYAVNERPAL